MQGLRRIDLRAWIALGFGVSSFVLGLSAALLVSYGFHLQFVENRISTLQWLYHLTSLWTALYIVPYAMVTLVLAVAGWWATGLGRGIIARVSVAGSARRFSTAGTVFGLGLIALLIFLQVVRWLIWGWPAMGT
jgi:F0F1-type ATP synthase membrane subunit c/vacuolar-type H+-ATPase subunit K